VRVLVTGGAGFIGRRIVSVLLEDGHGVRVLDVAGAASPDVEVVTGDVRDAAAVARAVRGVDAVCHQAAKVGLGVDFGDVGDYVSVNDCGTAVLLDALWRGASVERLVLASSMVVYGEGQGTCPAHGLSQPGPRKAADLAAGRFENVCPRPGCEEILRWVAVGEDAKLDPRNVYAATKLHQEQLSRLWGRETGATVVALRYHNVYGPGMPRETPYAGVAAIFRSALAAGRRPGVFEDGGQTRDFVHVDDVARANALALARPAVAEGAYNIGSGTAHTVIELAQALASAWPESPAPVVTGQWRLGDVRHVVASSAKARRELDFVAHVGFDEGMAAFAGEPAAASPG